MNIVSGYLGVAFLADVALGISVLWTHPRRLANQAFFALCMLLAGWLASLAAAFGTDDVAMAEWAIRGCSVTGAMIPLFFTFLRYAILGPQGGWSTVLRRSAGIGAVALALGFISFTTFYLRGATLDAAMLARRSVPEPVYGPGFSLFAIYFGVTPFWLAYMFLRSARRATGIQRTELQFSMLGAVAGILTGFVFVVMLPVVTGNPQWTQMAPLAVIALDGVIAYGIATRRIMEVAQFLRIVTAYSFLTVYLVALYLIIRAAAAFVIHALGFGLSVWPEVLGTLTVAFSVAPAHGLMQRVANHLFVHGAVTDLAGTLRESGELLQSVRTVSSALGDVAGIVKRYLAADGVLVAVASEGGFVEAYPCATGTPLRLDWNAPLLNVLRIARVPLVKELVRRVRMSPELEAACRQMDELSAAAAAGIWSKEGLAGLLVVGPRLSGRIYGVPEQQALQLLCNQLGIGLENAKLYTQLQDGKIYNEILLDSLVSGVIAADRRGHITVFNREAQRILRLGSAAVLDQPIERLPRPLADLLRETLERGGGVRDRDLSLECGPNDETPVRAGSAVFRGHAGDVLGILAVLHDLTALKKLEQQVRRGDRLASLGTLSAGMAHEIKNPLVTIKTFTELLPSRYEDSDFRDTFFSLVGAEVKRIDSIVNQLLRFSRPAKPILAPTRLHDVLDNGLRLLRPQCLNRNVQVERQFEAANDRVSADADQISQAFINILLNAVDAMAGGGLITVATRGVAGEDGGAPGIEVSIRDTGEGIPAEQISHIFDPFFTTKSSGTGLGLSVAHGIVDEHGGAIDVESEPGRGTVFRITLPLEPAGKGSS